MLACNFHYGLWMCWTIFHCPVIDGVFGRGAKVMGGDGGVNPTPTVKRGLRVFYCLCAILAVLDVFGLRHAESPIDSLWGFYAGYGFLSCVVLVIAAKWMRTFLMRDEDYYEQRER